MNGDLPETTSNASNDDELLDEERLFDLLGNERRRSCLRCLAGVEATVAVQDLASRVTVQVSDEECSPDDIRDSVYISLCQNHLPKLDDAGVVDYDAAEKTVGPRRALPVVERHLRADAVDASGRDAMRYYFLTSVVTVLVLAAVYAVPAALPYAVPVLVAVHAVAVLATGRRLF